MAAARRSMFDGATIDDIRPPEWDTPPATVRSEFRNVQHATMEVVTELANRVSALEVQVAESQAEIVELHAENDWLRKENERVNHLLAFSWCTSFQSHSLDEGRDLIGRNIPVKVVFVPKPETTMNFPYNCYLHLVPLYEDDRPEGEEPPAWWDRVLGLGEPTGVATQVVLNPPEAEAHVHVDAVHEDGEPGRRH